MTRAKHVIFLVFVWGQKGVLRQAQFVDFDLRHNLESWFSHALSKMLCQNVFILTQYEYVTKSSSPMSKNSQKDFQ